MADGTRTNCTTEAEEWVLAIPRAACAAEK